MTRLLLLAMLLFVAQASAQERTHVVHQGDTLAKLTWTYGVSGDSILHANHLKSAALRPGTTLVIPGAEAPPRAEPATTARAPAISPPPAPTSQPAAPVATPAGPLSGSRDFSEAIAIPAAQNLRYNARWVPPGESDAWAMDCSNTARWLYREVRGITLPRTASDQYELLRKRHRLWKTRDERALRKRLRPGDLLFWENTYKPTRRPPVTHVMVYLGTNDSGRMMMAGSQGSSGPDIYEFKPSQQMGGYRFFFFFRRDGRFVAYGRP